MLVQQCQQQPPRWQAQCEMYRALRSGDLIMLRRLLDLGTVDCDQRFSSGGGARPALCVAIEQVSDLLPVTR